MTIEITSPDVEALIQQCMRAGAFKNPEDLIRATLRSSLSETKTAADLIGDLPEVPDPKGAVVAFDANGGVQSAADIVLEEMRKVPADVMASWPKKEA